MPRVVHVRSLRAVPAPGETPTAPIKEAPAATTKPSTPPAYIAGGVTAAAGLALGIAAFVVASRQRKGKKGGAMALGVASVAALGIGVGAMVWAHGKQKDEAAKLAAKEAERVPGSTPPHLREEF